MALDRVALLNAAMDAATLALAGGDYATAIRQALIAQGLASVLPKASRSQGTGGGEQSASWDAAEIDGFIRNLRKQQGATLGVQSAPVFIIEPAVQDDGQQFANSSGGYVQ